MRSATSYFNGALYRKTLARFWPLWGCWGVVWLFLIPLNLLNNYFNRHLMGTAPRDGLLDDVLRLPICVEVGLCLAAFFAILCAMAVFGYLYNSRSACWTHALPLRREALFTTQYLAGLSFLLLPLAAVAVLTAIIEASFLPMGAWGSALAALLTWLLPQCGICLFFFSFAAFCAMFTGHILALPVFYGILNLLAYVVYYLIDLLLRQFFFGYAGTTGAEEVIKYLTPIYALEEAVRWWSENGFNAPGTIAAYAAVGVLLAAASLYVYRRRHVETAGDVVAVPLVRPLFKYGVAFCSGLCLGMFTSAFFGWSSRAFLIPCILIWTVVGCFVAQMFLKKSFRVFKDWKGAAVMAAVMLLLCLVCMTDLFGVEARVPRLDQVEELAVWLELGSPYDDGGRVQSTLTDPEEIQRFLDYHQAIVDDLDRIDSSSPHFEPGDDYTTLELAYTLKGGGTVKRDYGGIPLYREDIDREGSVTNLFRQLCDDRELAAQAYNFDFYLEKSRLTSAWLSTVAQAGQKSDDKSYTSVYVDDYAQELWDAVRKDFDEGTIGVRYPFYQDAYANNHQTSLNFGFTDNLTAERPYSGNPANHELRIYLTPNAKNTLAVLEKTGIYEEGYSLAPYDESYYSGGTVTYGHNTSEIVY